MFGLEEKHIKYIISVLDENIENGVYYIFGSRAKGDFKKYSDIDIALDIDGKKLDSHILSKISAIFEDSTLPYEVDLIDLNSISESFANLIKDSLVKLN